MSGCKDINGVNVSQFVFSNDGTVLGVLPYGTSSTDSNSNQTKTSYLNQPDFNKGFDSSWLKSTPTNSPNISYSPISQECCNAFNFNWDVDTNKCFWTELCDADPELKLSLGADGNEGVIFQVQDDEVCQLEVKFDYLLQFDCNSLQECYTEGAIQSSEYNTIVSRINELNTLINESEDRIESETNKWNDDLRDWNRLISGKEGEISIATDKLKVLNDEYDRLNALIESNNVADEVDYVNEANLVYQDILVKQNELNTLNGELTDLENNKEQQELTYNDTIAAINDEITLYQAELDTLTETKENLDLSGDLGVTCLSNFNNLNIWVQLDKIEERNSLDNVSYQSNKTFDTVYEEPLYQIDDIVDYFDGNCNTGLYVSGTSRCKEQLYSCLAIALSANCNVLSACTLDSDWKSHSFTITDIDTLTAIENEEIKLSFLVKNSDCDLSILVDKIEFNKNCTETNKQDVYVTKNPSFDIERVIDNKKSWVTSEDKQDRDYYLTNRETSYDINDYRLGINTKEIDLEISPATAVNTDVWCYLNDNLDVLGCSTGYTSTDVFTNYDFETILFSLIDSCKPQEPVECTDLELNAIICDTETCGDLELNAVSANTPSVLISDELNINNCGNNPENIKSSWALDVYIEDCSVNNLIYSGTPFFETFGLPTQEDYITEIINISNQLGLLYEINGDYITLKQLVIDCDDNYINKDLCVDLRLEIISCNS